MADFNAKTATPDTSITNDDSILIGADSQSAATPSVYSFGTIKTWIKSWIAKADVGLGNVSDNLQLVASNNLSDLTDAGAARNNLAAGVPFDPDFGDSQIYLCTPISSATSSGAMTANRIGMTPIYVPRTRQYTTYAVVLTATAGTSIIRVGLYSTVTPNGYLQPNAKLDEGATTIDASTATGSTGLKTVAFTANQTLKPGWYFLASVSDGTPSVQRTSSAIGLGARFSGSGVTMSGAKYRDAGASTLPSDESAQTYTSSASAGTALPLVGIR